MKIKQIKVAHLLRLSNKPALFPAETSHHFGQSSEQPVLLASPRHAAAECCSVPVRM